VPFVVSAAERRGDDRVEVWVRKVSESEPLMTCRKKSQWRRNRGKTWALVGPSGEIAGLSTSAQGQRLQRIGRTAKDSVKLLRAIVVLMSAQGQSAPDIAHLLAVARAVSTRLTKSARAAYIGCAANVPKRGGRE
jgi:hypothetical protein